jgi:hypothetical protein
MTKWNKTEPPHRTQKPVTLRVRDGSNPDSKSFVAPFVWSTQENTWVEVCEGPDGFALYKDLGWVVLGWK